MLPPEARVQPNINMSSPRSQSTAGVVRPIAIDAGEAFAPQRNHTDKGQIFARMVRSLYAQLPSLARCAASTDAMFSAISTAENSPDLYADLMNLPHKR
ncbi:hypothetical protein LTR10_003426 [Elasticomyces elasticus]|nr:hypothetical protein LTR10_003426 [Elasticomyces elasticus]KAK4969694.1 hypothetical protein LTR42_008966 [Elasticomyces elasticus]